MTHAPSSLALATGTVDLVGGRFTLHSGAQRQLTEQERAMLAFLARRPHQDLSRDELQGEVLGYAPTAVSRAADHTIKRLRLKIEAVPARPTHIITVQGMGYRFVPLGATGGGAGVLRLGDREVDLDRLELRQEGRPTLTLSSIEGQLLERLLARGGKAVSNAELLAQVWGVRDKGRSKLVGKAVYRLRAKLEEDPGEPVYLRTVRGRGLALCLPEGALLRPASPSTDAPAAPAPPESTGVSWVCEPPPVEVLGRLQERVQVEAALQQPGALVTLGGAGGMGKTTLARLIASHWPDPASFVDLTAARSGQALREAMAAAHGVDLAASQGPDPVVHALAAAGPVLVVVDNAESCLEAVRELIDHLRRAAPAVRFLVTSREPLHHPAEHLVRLEGLDPESARVLFERQAVKAGASGGAAEAVAQLTRSLHHMPLAIEIAAARAPLLGVAGILARLHEPLRLLRSRSTLSPRHASLQQVLEVSWAPLAEEVRRALAACALFEGEFSAEAAEAVLDEADALDHLQELMNHMLLGRRADGRLALSLAVADFARQELDPRHGAWLEGARLRWLRWVAGLGGDLREPGSEPAPAAYPRLLPELEGAVRAARSALQLGQRGVAGEILLWVLPVLHRLQLQRRALQLMEALGDPGDLPEELRPAVALRLMLLHFTALQTEQALGLALRAQASEPGGASEVQVLAFRVALGPRGPAFEADLEEADRLLAEDGLSAQLRLLLYGGLCALYEHLPRRIGWCRARVACARSAGLPWARSDACYQLANILAYAGRAGEAEAPAHAMVAPYEAAGLGVPGKYSGIMGAIRSRQGRLEEAEAYATRAYELASAGGAVAFVAWICSTLGKIAGTRGDYEACAEWFARAGAGAAELGDQRGVALSEANLGETWRRLGRLPEARAALRRSADGFEALGETGMRAGPLRSLGRLELEAGEPLAAAAVLELALEVDPSPSNRRCLTQALLAQARAQLGQPGAWTLAQEAVAEVDPEGEGEDAVLVHVLAARVALDAGRLEDAGDLAARAQELVDGLALDGRAEAVQQVAGLMIEAGLAR